MSKTIDERIVSMQFDNRHFESNVQTSLSTLDKLKRSLHLDGASKGLENIEKAAGKVDLSSVSDSADKVGLRFSAMYTMADQALRNITNAAMNAGKRIVSSLTIDPVKMGFQEYETQMNAVQTILANTKSKGTTLDDVNGALDELNLYADKTIYNFTEMTRNIGTFTAAGVDLDTSVSAIKGIANLAAVSGSSSQQASTAMYQLSQAMASGTVKLMDWNSVVNAGMGGQVFQDALKETAKVHGVAIDDIIKKQGSFRESLSTGWLTTEILTETLSKFTGDLNEEQLKSMGYTEEQIKGILELGQTANDAATKVKTFTQLLDTLKEAAQSGWSQTWRIIFGDFEESKEMFSKVSDVLGKIIGDSAEARNSMLEDWKILGGRDDLIKSLSNAFEALMSVIEPIKEAFRDIFPRMTGERLAELTANLKEFTSKLILTDTASDNLKRTFKGIFAIFSIVVKIISALAKAIAHVLGYTDDLGGGILSITAAIGDWLVALNDAIENSDIFTLVLGTLARGIGAVLGVFAKLIRAFQSSFIFKTISAAVEYFINVLSGAGDAMDQLSGKMEEIKAAWEASGIYKFLSSLWKIVKSIVGGIIKLFSGFVDSISEAFGGGDFEKGFDIINGLLTGGLLAGLGIFVKKLIDLFSAPSSIVESLTGMFDSVGEAINSFVKNSKVDQLKNIAIAIAILAAALIALSFIDSEKIADALVGLSLAFGEMLGAMLIINKIAKKDPEAMVATQKSIASMVKLSIGLLILSYAIKKIGDLEWETWAKGILGVGAVMIALAYSQKMMSKATVDPKQIKASYKSIVAMALALGVIASVVKNFGSMDPVTLLQGLLGITAVLLVLSNTMQQFTNLTGTANEQQYTKAAASLMIMSLALQMITPSILIFGLLPVPMLIQGIVGVGAMLAALAGVQIMLTKLAGNAGKMNAAAASLTIMAVAIQMFTPSILIFGLLPIASLLKGVIGVIALLSALVGVQIALCEIGRGSGAMNAAASSLVILASSINILIPTLTLLALLPLGAVLQSVMAITLILGILSGAMLLLSNFGGGGVELIATASSIAIMSSAILVLTIALTALAILPIALIIKSLVTLAAALTILGVAALVLSPLAPVILTLATAFLAFGKGVLLAGLGVVALGVGLAALAAGLSLLLASLTVIAGSLGLLCNVIVELFAAMIEGIIVGIGRGLLALGQVIVDSINVIKDIFLTIVLAFIDVIRQSIPAFIDVCFELVARLCESFAKWVPMIVSSLLEMLTNVLISLAEKLPGLIKAAVDVLFAFITGVIEAFGGIDPAPLLQMLKNVTIITLTMAALAAMTALTPAAMAGVVGMGIVIGELAILLAAMGALSLIPGLTWIIEKGGDLLEAIGTAVGRLIGGILGGIAKGMTGSLPEIGSDLGAFMTNAQPFFDAANNINAATVEGVKGLVDIILSLTAANIIESLTSWLTGGSSLTKFGEQIASFGPNIRAYADAVSGIDATTVEASVNAAKMLSDLAHNLPNDGGLMGILAGENNIGAFGKSLVDFGIGMKSYADSVSGIDTEAVTSSANAGKTLAELANTLPNTGSIFDVFSGSKNIGEFGKSLVPFGQGIKGFADEIAGIDAEGVSAAAVAGKGLAELTNMIPNQNGIITWFTGDNSISKFGSELVELGRGLKGFATETAGIDAAALAATATAAKALAEMTNMIPNQNGIITWFTGDSSISKFSGELVELGRGLKGFAAETAGINADSLTATSTAAKTLAEMCDHIPAGPGIASWFTGEQSISKFGGELASLGRGLKGFATETDGINPDTVTAAANAAKILAEMTEHIPNDNGIMSWFKSDNSISKFGSDMVALGTGLKGFATETDGINPDTVTAAANAAKTLAEMTEHIPNEPGVLSWLTGEKSLSKFADELPKLGDGIKGFSTSVEGVVPENITAAASAAKDLAEMTEHIPDDKGIIGWFTGKTSITEFADKLPKLGEGLKGFSKSVEGIVPENLTAASDSATAIAEMCKTALPNVDKIPDLATNLKSLGTSMKACFGNLGGITAESITAANNAIATVEKMNNVSGSNLGNVANSINEVVSAIKNLATIPANSTANFSSAMSNVGKASAKSLVDAFKNIKADMQTAGSDAINAFVTGVNNKKNAATSAWEAVISACTTVAKDSADDFSSAGSSVVTGFANGITANAFKAEAKAKAMAEAALEAARESLEVNSPSKAFRRLGYSIPEGFAMGIDKLSNMATSSSMDMANASINNVQNAMSKVAEVVSSDIDTQPTIRPVLDLSDVRAGANSIGGLFGSKASVGVLARVNSINASMNNRIQNGETSAIVDGINKLNKQLKNMDNTTYSINGVTLTGDSGVEEAFETILRAAKIERRR